MVDPVKCELCGGRHHETMYDSVNGGTMTLWFCCMQMEQHKRGFIKEAEDRGFERGLAQGRRDGYRDGYQSGYIDGKEGGQSREAVAGCQA